MAADVEDGIVGSLLGTALGDALGLPAEGLSARAARRRFGGRLERFQLLGKTGYVSDDTELSALVAQSLLLAPDDAERCALELSRALLGWALRLPWGAGLGTLRACARIGLRRRPTGVRSAGNGAAMRAAVVGACFHDWPQRRQRLGRALARVTHTDARAVDGALFAAELAAAAVAQHPPRLAPAGFEHALAVAAQPELGAALERARDLAAAGASVETAAAHLGTSGYVVHSVPFAAFCLLRHDGDVLGTLSEAVGAGGDADSIGAVLGAWLGSLHGASGLPQALVGRLQRGPFGRAHLEALGRALARIDLGPEVPRFSRAAALARNLALYPVVLLHGLRRLVPL
jgi:ADP-ribosyl-[dinitrogen reductase] hydrolase